MSSAVLKHRSAFQGLRPASKSRTVTTADVLWVHLMQGIFLLKQKITIKKARALGPDLAEFSFGSLKAFVWDRKPSV